VVCGLTSSLRHSPFKATGARIIMDDWLLFPLLLIGSTLVGLFLAHLIGWLDGKT